MNLLIQCSLRLLLAYIFIFPAATPSAATEVLYPPDAGVINVKTQLGAVGDGKTNDTDALLRGIHKYVGQYGFGILFFPRGKYMVDERLAYLTSSGAWGAYLTLQGEDENTTIIQLIDDCPGFQDPSNPVAVIFTASNSGNVDPSSPQYNPTGAGNEGFRNHIKNLTVSTGLRNPGAIAVDYMANNDAEMSDVTLVSPDLSAQIGLNIQRGSEGPMLLERVKIIGFAEAMVVANSYGVWAEHLTISDQLVSGIVVDNGSVSIRDLESSNTVPAVVMQDWTAVASLIDPVLTGGSSSNGAIQLGGVTGSEPTLFLSNATSTGYGSLVSQAGIALATSPQKRWTSTAPMSLFSNTSPPTLVVQETPTYTDNNFNNWANPVAYGAQPYNPALVFYAPSDSRPAIQATLNSGLSTVFLPPGCYAISDTLFVPPSVKRIIFLSAWLIPLNATFPSTHPAIQIEGSSEDPVFIEGLGLTNNWNLPGSNGFAVFPDNNFSNNSTRTVVITDADGMGYSSTTLAANTTLFLESVSGTAMRFSEQSVFARSLDPENSDSNPHVNVFGGSLWNLGLKIEGSESPVLVNAGGATTYLLGVVGCIFSQIPANIPMFENLSSSLVVSAYRTNPYAEPGGGSNYDVLVQETFDGNTRYLYGAGSNMTPSAMFYGFGSVGSLFDDIY